MRLSVKLIDIFQRLEREYPVKISHQFASNLSMSDNSGMLVNFDDEIQQILFTLDLTHKAVEKALEYEANCIISHHPVIFKPVKSLSMMHNTAPLLKAISNKINIISMHLNADAAENGIDYFVAKGLGLKQLEKVEHTIFENCYYGRIFQIEKKSLNCILQDSIQKFNSDKIWLFGNKDREVERVASFCGAGIDSATVQFIRENNVELVVSSDIKHNILIELFDANIAVMQMTHYANENYGFYEIYKNIEKKLPCACHYFIDKNLL